VAPEVAFLPIRRALSAHDLDDNATGDVAAAQDEYNEVERRLHWTLLGLVGSAGPLDTYPGMAPSGSDYYQKSVPHALRLRALLMKEIHR